MAFNLCGITVLKNIKNDKVFSAFLKYAENDDLLPDFLSELFVSGCESDFLSYICKLIITDVNTLSTQCSKGRKPSSYLKSAYLNDLNYIFSLILKTPTHGCYAIGNCTAPFDEKFDHETSFLNICNFYRKNGYGEFIDNIAFCFDGNLVPIKNPSKVTLKQLKNYDYEKKVIYDNLQNFLQNLPYCDMLLYGDMGTGKSSTVHAMLNEFASSGLRLIELKKENLSYIAKIRQTVSDNPLKFIIFIDDLSLKENDSYLSTLKAQIEGSVSDGTCNTMIIATSNRRHIVNETFSERENSVHSSDTMQEQLSLSDRFGITVLFSSTDKQEYLSIINQLAKDYKLKSTYEEINSLAEKWALVKGGRSPRKAKQFVELLFSCEVNGKKFDF